MTQTPPSPSSNDAQWYLDLPEGRKGPFRKTDIEHFYRAGQIKVTDWLSSPSAGGRSIQVQDLLGLGTKSPSPPPMNGVKPNGAPFQPPPRPDPEKTSTKIILPPKDSPTNPTLSLFDSLQAARERKPREPMFVPEIAPPSPGLFSGISLNKIFLTLGIIIALALGAWSAYEYYRKSLTPPPSKEKSPPVATKSAPPSLEAPTKSVTADHPAPTTRPNPFGSKFQPQPVRTGIGGLGGGAIRSTRDTPSRDTPSNDRNADRDTRRDDLDRERDRDRDRDYLLPHDSRDLRDTRDFRDSRDARDTRDVRDPSTDPNIDVAPPQFPTTRDTAPGQPPRSSTDSPANPSDALPDSQSQPQGQ